MKFNKGDKVMVIDGSAYRLTKEGSIGVLKGCGDGAVGVVFIKITNIPSYPPPHEYNIRESDLELCTPMAEVLYV